MFRFLFKLSVSVFCIMAKCSLESVWELPAQTISDIISFNSQVGVDNAGNSVAIWERQAGGGTTVQAATLPFAGTWSSPADVSSLSPILPGDFQNPQIAVDAAGNAVAVWVESNAITTFIQAARLPFGQSTWIPATADLSGPNAFAPQVGVDAHGNAVAVWIGTVGSHTVIQGATLPFGTNTWFPTTNLSSTSFNSTTPQVAVDPSGNAVAVWTIQLPNRIVQSATMNFGSGVWVPATANLSAPGQNAARPQVDVDHNGNAVAVWSRSDGTNLIVQGATLAFSPTPPHTWVATSDLSLTGVDSQFAQVSVDPFGNAVAVWLESTNGIIQATSLSAGSSMWSTPPVDISTPGSVPDDQQVATDGNGNAFAVWDATNGLNRVIQAVMLPFGGSWTNLTVLSKADENSTRAELSVNPRGDATVSWTNESLGVIQATTWTLVPMITNVNPNTGPTTGGNSVTITGTDFMNVINVTFGETSAISFVVNSPTSITAIVPPGAEGTVDIRVTTSVGISPITVHDEYTYVNLSPPFAPVNFIGVIVKDKFLTQTAYFLRASWRASPSSNVVSYRIFKNGVLVATIKATASLVFFTNISSEKSAEKFEIAAVDSKNRESKRVKIRILDDDDDDDD